MGVGSPFSELAENPLTPLERAAPPGSISLRWRPPSDHLIRDTAEIIPQFANTGRRARARRQKANTGSQSPASQHHAGRETMRGNARLGESRPALSAANRAPPQRLPPDLH